MQRIDEHVQDLLNIKLTVIQHKNKKQLTVGRGMRLALEKESAMNEDARVKAVKKYYVALNNYIHNPRLGALGRCPDLVTQPVMRLCPSDVLGTILVIVVILDFW